MSAVLFLDVDGVLNHVGIFKADRDGAPLCPDAISRLRRLVEKTGCNVVLSSTWRLGGYLKELREAGGLPNPHKDWRTGQAAYDTSPGGVIVSQKLRGKEISEWLSRHPEVTAYAIVDDDSDMLDEQMSYFVKTEFETGLLDDHCERLAAILCPRPS